MTPDDDLLVRLYTFAASAGEVHARTQEGAFLAGEPSYLGLLAGPFRVALPVKEVKQILHMEGPFDKASLDAVPISLPMLLGHPPKEKDPAYLLFEGAQSDYILSTCEVHGVFVPTQKLAVKAVPQKWPGLNQSALWGIADLSAQEYSYLELNLAVLFEIVEAT